MKNGGWIFISHSHKDIDLVRKIRNHFEKLGFEPLMFYLKCLNDEDEIEGLIKREIDERDWFVYADSPNARTSKWVKTEREYIEKLTGKNVFTIDLNSDIETQLNRIEHISRQMKVFISYSRKDEEIKKKIESKLIEKDMLVLSDDNIAIGSNFYDSIGSMIDEAARDGFVVLLVSEYTKNNLWMKTEIERVIKAKGKIIPVYIDNATLDTELYNLLKDNIKAVLISSQPTDEELDKITETIIHNIEFYDSDFTNSCGYRSAEIIHLPCIAQIDSLTFYNCPNLKCVYVPNSVIYISSDAFDEHPDILVKCYANSYTEDFCKKHNILYEAIED